MVATVGRTTSFIERRAATSGSSRSLRLKQLAHLRHPRRHRDGAAIVNIHIRDLSQLFNSLDPSPFWDRDLDREAAQFIEEEFSEKLSAEHLYERLAGIRVLVRSASQAKLLDTRAATVAENGAPSRAQSPESD